ncbi:acyltransferase family protein [Comamonas humi]
MDGLRAIAIVLVFLSHAHVPLFDGAFLGVDIFFVLSGYLITSLLLMEHRREGHIDYGRFYYRRFLRLMPALLFFLAVYWVVAPLLWPDDKHLVTQDVLVSMAYLADYGIAFFDSPDSLLHMWSLSVEEHYYLVWPVLLAYLLRRMPPARVWGSVALLYVLAFLWRAWWVDAGQPFYQVFFRFDTRATGMLLGSLLATLVIHRHTWFEALARHQHYLLWLVPMFPLLLTWEWGDSGALLWGIALAELATLAILVAIYHQRGVVFDMLSIRPLVWLGKVSYGIYLWHYPVVRVLRAEFSWPVVVAVGLPVSIALAALSFYTVERWALRWRDGIKRPAPARAKAPVRLAPRQPAPV